MEYTTLDELAHSDGYYAATEPITGNELKHFKYIDRYKNSHGNWVYVYADKKIHDRIKKAQATAKVKNTKSRMINKIANIAKKGSENHYRNAKFVSNLNHINQNYEISTWEGETYNSKFLGNRPASRETVDAYNRAGEAYNNAYKKFSKQSVSLIDDRDRLMSYADRLIAQNQSAFITKIANDEKRTKSVR